MQYLDKITFIWNKSDPHMLSEGIYLKATDEDMFAYKFSVNTNVHYAHISQVVAVNGKAI